MEAGPSDVSNGLFDSIANVEQLHIQENFFALVPEFMGKFQPFATHDELKTDLVDSNFIAEIRYKITGIVGGRSIKRNYQPISRF